MIGNSAYAANLLPNPINDATDIAANLLDADFLILLRTDLDLAGMELAIADFQRFVKGKDTALIYYAGHGVQVEGENFLIPVEENIQSTAQAKSRSVSFWYLMDQIKASGVKTALLFLDACQAGMWYAAGSTTLSGLLGDVPSLGASFNADISGSSAKVTPNLSCRAYTL
ncbi:MAG: caspase family protein [Spirochaetaceae bacterium]|nr:caspase family protein [Spirochaetaceae bacterium]